MKNLILMSALVLSGMFIGTSMTSTANAAVEKMEKRGGKHCRRGNCRRPGRDGRVDNRRPGRDGHVGRYPRRPNRPNRPHHRPGRCHYGHEPACNNGGGYGHPRPYPRPHYPRPNHRIVTRVCYVDRVDNYGYRVQTHVGTSTGLFRTGVKRRACNEAMRRCERNRYYGQYCRRTY